MPNTFEKLIQLDRAKEIPVIFMIVYPKLEIKNQVLKMGAKDCISKPVISNDFEQTIATAIT